MVDLVVLGWLKMLSTYLFIEDNWQSQDSFKQKIEWTFRNKKKSDCKFGSTGLCKCNLLFKSCVFEGWLVGRQANLRACSWKNTLSTWRPGDRRPASCAAHHWLSDASLFIPPLGPWFLNCNTVNSAGLVLMPLPPLTYSDSKEPHLIMTSETIFISEMFRNIKKG